MTSQIEITIYDKSIATPEEIKRIFYKNIADTSNVSSFNGVYQSMKIKYGIFTYFIMLLPSLLFFTISTIPHLFVIDWPLKISLIVSIVGSIVFSFWLFGHFFVTRNFKMFMQIAKDMLKNYDDMDKRYSKTGGAYIVALAENKETGKKEVVGHLGLVNLQAANPELQKIGYIEAVGVNAEFRKFGIARRMVEKTLEFAAEGKFEALHLRTMNINTGGINLYSKFGFKLTGSKEIEPITGLSIISMQKKLL